MAGPGDSGGNRLRALWVAVCCRARALWGHRTKIIGALGVIAGGAESFLDQYPQLHLPRRGVLLMVFGAIVTAVGVYNTLAEYWRRP